MDARTVARPHSLASTLGCAQCRASTTLSTQNLVKLVPCQMFGRTSHREGPWTRTTLEKVWVICKAQCNYHLPVAALFDLAWRHEESRFEADRYGVV